MSEYTPEMATIRKAYRNSAYTGGGLPEMSDAEFERWIAAHDRAVKAEALREAAEDWGDTTWNDVWMADGVEDDVSAVQSTVKWLRERADQIEGNTE